MTKAEQTRWNKPKSLKRMSPEHLQAFRSWLFLTFPTCQICGSHASCEAHHAKYGRSGADKDDRTLVALCHPCHYEIHHGKDGYAALGVSREDVERIGEKNYERYIVEEML
ncbi:hypothetical protein [Hydrogenimonas urashimensis]|uniref:hypothetical protein n=1 Tax=Hydrogenimonas urashimensis TaxID=2740515 RepID=UPI001915B4BD|nr:hypothetical protein [Hydrogenimonas urashimensis]